MKLKGLSCPSCNKHNLPLDHYAASSPSPCPDPVIPEDEAQNMIDDILSDTTHVFGNITCTRLLGCARDIAIQDTIPLSIDLTKRQSMHNGTEKHQALASRGKDGNHEYIKISGDGKTPIYHDVVDTSVRRELTVRGKLFGVEMQATIDRLSPEGIIEYKTTKFGFKLTKEHEVQTSIQALLWAELEYPKIRLWSLSWTGGYTYYDIEPLAEEECGEYKPLGGEVTVRQNATLLDLFYKNCDKNDPEPAIKSLPLSGRDMKIGKQTKCFYCTSRRACDRMEGIVSL